MSLPKKKNPNIVPKKKLLTGDETPKCKICGEDITVTINGAPFDICWNCVDEKTKNDIIQTNMRLGLPISITSTTKTLKPIVQAPVEIRDPKPAKFKKINWKRK